MSKGIPRRQGSTTNGATKLPKPDRKIAAGGSILVVLAYFFATMSAPVIAPPLAQAIEESQVALGLDVSRGERER